jgi:hypothetical protein
VLCGYSFTAADGLWEYVLAEPDSRQRERVRHNAPHTSQRGPERRTAIEEGAVSCGLSDTGEEDRRRGPFSEERTGFNPIRCGNDSVIAVGIRVGSIEVQVVDHSGLQRDEWDSTGMDGLGRGKGTAMRQEQSQNESLSVGQLVECCAVPHDTARRCIRTDLRLVEVNAAVISDFADGLRDIAVDSDEDVATRIDEFDDAIRADSRAQIFSGRGEENDIIIKEFAEFLQYHIRTVLTAGNAERQ